MTDADVNRLEAAIGVKLPPAYRHLLAHFPIRFDQGTREGPVWDNADALIERNRELRAPRRSMGHDYEPIPSHYVFIGDDGGGWQNLIDTRTEPPIVCVMEFEDVKTIRPHTDNRGQPSTLNDWFHEYLLELKNDGIDVSATTRPKQGGLWLSLGCLAAVLAVFLALALVMFTLKRLLPP